MVYIIHKMFFDSPMLSITAGLIIFLAATTAFSVNMLPSSPRGFMSMFQGLTLMALARFLSVVPMSPGIVFPLMTLCNLMAMAFLIVSGLELLKLNPPKPFIIMCIGGIAAFWSLYISLILRNYWVELLTFSLAAAVGFVIVIMGCFVNRFVNNNQYFRKLGYTAGLIVIINILRAVPNLAITPYVVTAEIAAYALLGISIMACIKDILSYQGELLATEINGYKDRLITIIQLSPFPIVISQLTDGRILMANDKARLTLGVSADKNDDLAKIDSVFVNRQSVGELRSQLEQRSVIDNYETELIRSKNDEKFWALVSARVIEFDYKVAVYMAFQDISNRKRMEIKLYDQATRDPLTGCYNRRQFSELALKEVSRSKRTGQPLAILMVDIDHFKRVNDTYGHATGDLVLKSLAEACRQTFRDTDIVSRFGGEEFVILLISAPSDVAFKLAERLRRTIEETMVKGENGENVHVTLSIGIALAAPPMDDVNIEEMIKDADAAMYTAKQSGRNRSVLFDKEFTIGTGEKTDSIIKKNPLAAMLSGQDSRPVTMPKASTDDTRFKPMIEPKSVKIKAGNAPLMKSEIKPLIYNPSDPPLEKESALPPADKPQKK
ncbi:MAG: sensor domain-containing diguanylate cyclase [Alphaproteobacteria bacterium]|nr:sensor domain-containing diguanylate cyclase [Alphaproteobacteria bacterium]